MNEGNGFWLAYYSDMSGLVPFQDEVTAYRYAVDNSMQVKWINFGTDIREAVQS